MQISCKMSRSVSNPLTAATPLATNATPCANGMLSTQTLKVALYGSLAATGKGHMSAEALLSKKSSYGIVIIKLTL